MDQQLTAIWESMRARYRAGTVAQPTTYYFSLGDGPGEKWTATLTSTACEVVPGRVGDANCVLKMPAAMFIKMVRGTYKPGAMDFLSGKIKTNDVALLLKLQEAFGL
jgi:SCP-2 sterol transfer family